jgi:hypothetical protein
VLAEVSVRPGSRKTTTRFISFGAVEPMIISHYFTNALQVVVFVLRMS